MRRITGRWIRIIGLLAVVLAVMAFMVVATGNHWVSDVVAGFSGLSASVGLASLFAVAWRSWRPQPVSATEAVPASINDARR